MPSASQRIRLTLVVLALLVLVTPGLAAARQSGQAAPARPAVASASAVGAFLARLRDLLGHLWEGRGETRPASGTAGLNNVHANAGCGIDPNGDGCHGW